MATCTASFDMIDLSSKDYKVIENEKTGMPRLGKGSIITILYFIFLALVKVAVLITRIPVVQVVLSITLFLDTYSIQFKFHITEPLINYVKGALCQELLPQPYLA